MDDDKEKQCLKQSAVVIEINETDTNLDETTLTNSTRKSKLCGSAKKNDLTMNSSKKCINKKEEEIQLKTFNSKQTDETKINFTNNNDQQLAVQTDQHKKKLSCKSKNQSKDDISIEEKVNNFKIIGKAIKRLIPCLVAWTLLVSSSGVYFAFVATELYILMGKENLIYWIVLMNFQCILFLYVVVNFLIAILRDPGRFEKIIISEDDPNFSDDTKSPLYKTVKIQKAAVKIKWCSVSFIFLTF